MNGNLVDNGILEKKMVGKCAVYGLIKKKRHLIENKRIFKNPYGISTFDNPKVEKSFRKLKKIVKKKNIDVMELFKK